MKAIKSPVQFIDQALLLERQLSHVGVIHFVCDVSTNDLHVTIISDSGYFGSVVLRNIFLYFPFSGPHFYVTVGPNHIKIQYID